MNATASEPSEAALVIFERSYEPADLFVPGAFDPLLAHIKTVVSKEIFDPSTEDGRTHIKRTAMRVTKTKTAIEEARLSLVAAEKRRLKRIDDQGKVMREALDSYADEVRKPVTDWEAVDQVRIDKHESTIAKLKGLGEFLTPGNTAEIEARLKFANETDPATFEEFEANAAGAKALAVAALTPMLEISRQADADRAELEALRAAKAEQERKDREAEQERQTKEAEANREWLTMYAEAEADNRVFDTKRQALIDAKRAADDAVEAERLRVAQQTEVAHQEEQRRERNKTHRAKINREAVAALVKEAGLSEDAAKSAVTAIAKGLIPAIIISY